MSLTGAMYTGVTGMNVLGRAIQVTGNNIANVNTIGFRSGRAEFADLFYQNIGLGDGVAQLGHGARLDSIARSFAQGALLNSDNATDMAVNGPGWFILGDGAGGE